MHYFREDFNELLTESGTSQQSLVQQLLRLENQTRVEQAVIIETMLHNVQDLVLQEIVIDACCSPCWGDGI